MVTGNDGDTIAIQVYYKVIRDADGWQHELLEHELCERPADLLERAEANAKSIFTASLTSADDTATVALACSAIDWRPVAILMLEEVGITVGEEVQDEN